MIFTAPNANPGGAGDVIIGRGEAVSILGFWRDMTNHLLFGGGETPARGVIRDCRSRPGRFHWNRSRLGPLLCRRREAGAELWQIPYRWVVRSGSVRS